MPRWLDRIDRDREHAAILVEAAAEHGEPPRPASADDQLYTLGEDPRERLRGLPAVGRGVGGAIRGTRPDWEAVRRIDSGRVRP